MKSLIQNKVRSFSPEKIPDWVITKAEEQLETELAALVDKRVTPQFIADIQVKGWQDRLKQPPTEPKTDPKPTGKEGKSSGQK